MDSTLAIKTKRPLVSRLTVEPGVPFAGLYSEPIERGLLSILARSPGTMAQVARLITARDFCVLTHSFIFHALYQLFLAHTKPDPIIVAEAVLREPAMQGSIDPDGARVRRLIEELFFTPSGVANAEHYARQVRDTADRLRLLNVLEQVKAAAIAREPLRTVGALARDGLLTALGQTLSPSSDMVTAATELQVSLDTQRPLQPLGLPSLDEALGGGLDAAELLILAGGGGQGKTTLALTLLYERARAGHADLFFSIEMTRVQVMRPLLSMLTSIRRDALAQRLYPEGQVAAAVEALAGWPLRIVHERPLTPADVRLRLELELVARPVEIVFIDGLWIMDRAYPPQQRVPERHYQYADIVNDLSAIAKDYHLPLVVVHQFSRQAQLTGGIPDLNWLGLTQAAATVPDVVLGLKRLKEAPGAEVHVLKNRHRTTYSASVQLRYDASSARYYDKRARPAEDVVF